MKTFIISIKVFVIFSLLTGILYPLFITGVAQLIFPVKANGSLITKNHKIVGSHLIGQKFDSTIYFASRPSATDYNTMPSGGTNLGLTNEKLKQIVDQRKKDFIGINHLDTLAIIPSEMLFASASGLDPHISAEAALIQVSRISVSRNFNENQRLKLIDLINDFTNNPQLKCLGEKRINVLELNLALDEMEKKQ